MSLLAEALDLLQRHHRNNRSVGYRSTPTSAHWHSLWGKLEAIREAATSGDVEARDWLAIHGPMITAVEACRGHVVRDALTYRGPGR